MMWHGGWMGPGWLLVSLTLMIIFWGGLVALIVWLVRSPRPDATTTQQPRPSAAEELLAERFARGEIDEEEFARRRALLRSARD